MVMQAQVEKIHPLFLDIHLTPPHSPNNFMEIKC